MPLLDIDTGDLVAAGHQAGAAASHLAGLTPAHLSPAAVAHAAGDPVLTQALVAFLDAWAPAHRDLVAVLDELGGRLADAAETFAGAEGAAAERLARLILPAGPDGTP
ncbi:hypothetical protein [Isoptericola aurantiacus]|uniref:hypothetical protein n=1 Tax=Isoptericola aurantiacus TaxID=3377839 RepID=UPI00383BD889